MELTAARVAAGTQPFRHWVATGLWPDDLLDAVVAEFPPPGDGSWKRYANDREAKEEGATLGGDAVRRLLDAAASDEMCRWLGDLTGIGGLTCETWGGGLHQIPPGGRLAVHADFNRSPETGRWRRLNLLVYLNRDVPDRSGDLVLDGDGFGLRIPPRWNCTVVFETSDRSWHGHPEALTWPHPRRSVAAYYYTDAPLPGGGMAHSTTWKGDL